MIIGRWAPRYVDYTSVRGLIELSRWTTYHSVGLSSSAREHIAPWAQRTEDVDTSVRGAHWAQGYVDRVTWAHRTHPDDKWLPP